MASWKSLRGETAPGANDGESEAEFRQLWSYFYQQVAPGKAATGVLTGLALTATAPASGSVSVGTGLAVCQPTTSGGVFPIPNSVGNLDIFTANPMQFVSNPRNDIVVADSLDGQVKALIGTPNATPSLGEPVVPATSVPLWRIRHAANATTIPGNNFDDLRVTVLPFGPAQASGRFTSAFAAVNNRIGNVSLPPGRFTTIPTVTMQIESSSGASRNYEVNAYNVTTTGFVYFLRTIDSAAVTDANVPIVWQAIEVG